MLQIHPVPAFSDDYVWLLHASDRQAFVVDPCCTHEHTLSNLRFARTVEPASAELEAREQRDKAHRERGERTVPTTIGLERATNPFLRCAAAEVRAGAVAHCASELYCGDEVLDVVRAWKDGFRG